MGTIEEEKRDVTKKKEWFHVDFCAINKKLFEEEREDARQEWARKQIVRAIKEVEEDPFYNSHIAFDTLVPEKTWIKKDIKGYEKIAESEGGKIAGWLVQCLEWAQKITNGETWENLCNKVDKLEFHRLVYWRYDYKREYEGYGGINYLDWKYDYVMFGGSYMGLTPTETPGSDSAYYWRLENRTVPLIVRF